MQVLSLIWGILAILVMMVAILPCFGALNWLNIPFAAIGIIISGIALGTAGHEPRGGAVAGLVCCGIALVIGFIRLILGAGVL
jgi:hypothetical protein